MLACLDLDQQFYHDCFNHDGTYTCGGLIKKTYHADKQLCKEYGKWTIREVNSRHFVIISIDANQINLDAILGAETIILDLN